MKKKTSIKPADNAADDDLLPEYDFSGGVRGKHYQARLAGYTLKIHRKDGTTLVKHIQRIAGIVLEPDVEKYFPDSNAVNRALRTLIALFPEKRESVNTKSRPRKREGKSVIRQSVKDR